MKTFTCILHFVVFFAIASCKNDSNSSADKNKTQEHPAEKVGSMTEKKTFDEMAKRLGVKENETILKLAPTVTSGLPTKTKAQSNARLYLPDQYEQPCDSYLEIVCPPSNGEGPIVRRIQPDNCDPEFGTHSMTGEIDFAQFNIFGQTSNGPVAAHSIHPTYDQQRNCFIPPKDKDLKMYATYLIQIPCELVPGIEDQVSSPETINDLDFTIKLFQTNQEVMDYNIVVKNYKYNHITQVTRIDSTLLPKPGNANVYSIPQNAYSATCDDSGLRCHAIIQAEISFMPRIQARTLQYFTYRIASQIENSDDILISSTHNHDNSGDNQASDCLSNAKTLIEFRDDNNPSNCAHLAEHTEILVLPICMVNLKPHELDGKIIDHKSINDNKMLDESSTGNN